MSVSIRSEISAIPSAGAASLHFRPVTVQSYSLLRRYLPMAGTRSCDYTLGGIAMWTGYFRYEYCIVGDTLFIKGLSEDGSGLTAFTLPCGRLPLSDSVQILKDHCRRQGIPLIFSAVPRDRLGDLMRLIPKDISVLPIWSDYIYSAQSLATLAGKAYNKKRNHVNRFTADNPGWQLRPYTPADIGLVLDLFTRLDSVGDKTDAAMAQYELDHTLDVLRDWDDFGLEGAILLDSRQRAVAFTAGEMSGDTLVLHIEKADHNVAGAGETVNQAFAAYMTRRYPRLKYINREDDSGDPGLRQAKMSYRPVALLEKFNVRF